MDTMDALADLNQRLVNAEAEIGVLANEVTNPHEACRLNGKAEGLSLCRDYLRHTMSLVDQTGADVR